jgi:hypothetical protein
MSGEDFRKEKASFVPIISMKQTKGTGGFMKIIGNLSSALETLANDFTIEPLAKDLQPAIIDSLSTDFRKASTVTGI